MKKGFRTVLLLSACPDIERRRHVEIVGDIALFAVRPAEELLLVLVACAVDNIADDRACGLCRRIRHRLSRRRAQELR